MSRRAGVARSVGGLGLVAALATSGCAAAHAPAAKPAAANPFAFLHDFAHAVKLPRPMRALAVIPVTPNVEPTAAVKKATPAMSPPEATLCVVHGNGAPFADRCRETWIDVTSDEAGAHPVARFDPRGADATWGLSGNASHTWVGVRDTVAGTELRGYTRTLPSFALLHEVALVPGHVWLEAGAPVKVAHVDERGDPVVWLDPEVDAIAGIEGTVPCGSLAFDETPAVVAAPKVVEARESIGFAIPKYATLQLRYEPGGRSRGSLRIDRKDPPFLQVFERLGPYARATLSTPNARFDVWIDRAEIDEDGPLGGLGLLSGICGNCIGYGDEPPPGERVSVAESTEVIVGSDPRAGGPSGLMLGKGQVVEVASRRKGFVEIRAFSSFAPPRGRTFFVPSSAIENAESTSVDAGE